MFFSLKQTVGKKEKKMYCQACRVRPVEVIEKCDDEMQPYELCKECHKRLLSYSLRPIEWYNLASIHTYNKFLLHDDFYEDNGEATQPEEAVEDADEYKAPCIDIIDNDIELLLDYCIAKWWLGEDMITCLKKHNPQALLESIHCRFNKSENYYVKDRLYEIAAKSLGSFCREWIRERWDLYNGEHLITLSEAAYYCLPFDEGYYIVKSALENIPENKLPHLAFCCLYLFRTSLNLEWIETKVNSPVKDSWGRLAAASNPPWEKLNEWINRGRPYSFVAIDTLVKLIPHPGESVLSRLTPKPVLVNPSPVDSMTQVLREYVEKDRVPRVRQGIEKIIDNWEIICWKRDI